MLLVGKLEVGKQGGRVEGEDTNHEGLCCATILWLLSLAAQQGEKEEEKNLCVTPIIIRSCWPALQTLRRIRLNSVNTYLCGDS